MQTEAEVSTVFGGTNIRGHKVAAGQDFDVDQPRVEPAAGSFAVRPELARLLQPKLVDMISIAMNPKFQRKAML